MLPAFTEAEAEADVGPANIVTCPEVVVVGGGGAELSVAVVLALEVAGIEEEAFEWAADVDDEVDDEIDDVEVEPAAGAWLLLEHSRPEPEDSHCNSLTMDGSDLAPSINSSNDKRPSEFLSICLNIFSVLLSGVDSSSGIFIVLPIIL